VTSTVGQHYCLVNTIRKQFISPEQFGDGLRLMEFGASGAGTMTALAVLLVDGNGRGVGDLVSTDPIVGSWAGDTIVIAGDYADAGRFVPAEDLRAFRAAMSHDASYVVHLLAQGRELASYVPTLYRVARALYEDISPRVTKAMLEDPFERRALEARGVKAGGR